MHASLVMLGILTACASADPTRAPSAGQEVQGRTPFDDLLRFAPDGMESLLLLDLTRAAPARLRETYAQYSTIWSMVSARRRVVLTAGKFRARGIGYGDWEGVFIHEFEADPWFERDQAGDPSRMRPHQWGAQRVFEQVSTANPHGSNSPEACWWAFVTPRILIEASRRHLLEAALRGDHPDGTTRARARGHETDVDWAAPLLVLRTFDATNSADYFSPVRPEQAVRHFAITSCCVSVLRQEPLRFQLDVRSPDAKAAFAGLAVRLSWNGPAAVEVEPGLATRAFLTADPRDQVLHLGLALDLLFGLNVMI